MRKLLILLPLLLGSCNAISSLIHDDQVVAKVGDNKLYKSEVEGFIPNMIPASDSVRLAEQYINSWAMDLLYLDVAEKELSKSELDVAAELGADGGARARAGEDRAGVSHGGSPDAGGHKTLGVVRGHADGDARQAAEGRDQVPG